MQNALQSSLAAIGALGVLTATVWATAPAPSAPHPTAAQAWAELHCGTPSRQDRPVTLIDREQLLEDQQALDQAAKAFGVKAVCAGTSSAQGPALLITLAAVVGR